MVWKLTSKATRDADPYADLAVDAIDNPTNVTFKITDTNLDVPVGTLSTENDKILLKQLRTRFIKQLNGINTYHKWLIRLKITT